MATVPSWRSSCTGSGLVDMNETIDAVRIDNDGGSMVYPPSRPFLEIAEYLSEFINNHWKDVTATYTQKLHLSSQIFSDMKVQRLRLDSVLLHLLLA